MVKKQHVNQDPGQILLYTCVTYWQGYEVMIMYETSKLQQQKNERHMTLLFDEVNGSSPNKPCQILDYSSVLMTDSQWMFVFASITWKDRQTGG